MKRELESIYSSIKCANFHSKMQNNWAHFFRIWGHPFNGVQRYKGQTTYFFESADLLILQNVYIFAHKF